MPGTDSTITPIITTPADPSLRGVGSFVVGTGAIFFFQFTDIDGILYDPSSMNGTIAAPDGTTVKVIDGFDKIEPGVFGYTWGIPSDADTGQYTITIIYTSETTGGTVTSTFSEEFVIIESGPAAFTLRQVASRAFLESLIGYAQRIPVFNETARFNKSRNLTKMTFPRWNQTAGVRVYVNNEIRETGFSINYLKGELTFDRAVPTYDEVMVDYNFRWFKDDELDQFIQQGINVVNIWPPQTSYTINSIGDTWLITAEYSAAINAIRRFMFDLQFQEPTKVFTGIQKAAEVFKNFAELKKNYEEEMFKMLEMKKHFPYIGLTRMVTVPEFTLPGGRSRWFRYLFSTN